MTGSTSRDGRSASEKTSKRHGRPVVPVPSGPGRGLAYRKRWLGGAEPARFAAADGPVMLDVGGWRVGLGICKDTGVFQHVAGIAALGVDLYAAGGRSSGPDRTPAASSGPP